MSINVFADWLDNCQQSEGYLYVKRLSGNDTLANGSHQAGPYVPRHLLFDIFPDLNQRENLNPRIRLDVAIESHGTNRQATVIWYNNKLFGKTRNEVRVTNWGGRSSAILDPKNTGAVAIFKFNSQGGRPQCRVWVCRNVDEEEFFEARYEPVFPGECLVRRISISVPLSPQVSSGEGKGLNTLIPRAWFGVFPSPSKIAAKACEICTVESHPDLDQRLLKRREKEYELYRTIERAIEMPKVTMGFTSMEEFLSLAMSITQRRKARAGLSLELQVRRILEEAGLVEAQTFSSQQESERHRRPDFLFPNQQCYQDESFPAASLRMLAVKTTCRDRWRQVLTEADRIPVKHLLTLQEGMSDAQLQEMKEHGVRLVVPTTVQTKYATQLRPHLLSLTEFVQEVLLIGQSSGTSN